MSAYQQCLTTLVSDAHMAHSLFVDSSKVSQCPDTQNPATVYDDTSAKSFQDELPLDSPYTNMITSSIQILRGYSVNWNSVIEKPWKKEKNTQACVPHIWVARPLNSHPKQAAFTSTKYHFKEKFRLC